MVHPAGHVFDEGVGGIPGDDAGDLLRQLDAVVEGHASAKRETDDGDLAGETVWRLRGLIDRGAQAFAVGVLHGVAVEQDNVIAELRDLLGHDLIVGRARHSGGHQDDAALALRRRKLLLRGGERGCEHRGSCEEEGEADVSALEVQGSTSDERELGGVIARRMKVSVAEAADHFPQRPGEGAGRLQVGGCRLQVVGRAGRVWPPG